MNERITITPHKHANGSGFAVCIDGAPVEWVRSLSEAAAVRALLEGEK